MENFDLDLRSIQEARNLARQGEEAAKKMATYTSEQIDKILKSMVEAVPGLEKQEITARQMKNI